MPSFAELGSVGLSSSSLETGTLNVAGQMAGYAITEDIFCDYQMNIAFIKDDTFIWISACYFDPEADAIT